MNKICLTILILGSILLSAAGCAPRPTTEKPDSTATVQVRQPGQQAPASQPQSKQQGGKKPQNNGQGNQFNIEQALSPEAQGKTFAFSGLAFLTGDFNADTFFPPGKVADYWGFQFLRDNDPSGMGHNTDFLTYASLNVLSVLTEEQFAELQTLAENQVEKINTYALNRFVLIDAFRRNLVGDYPAGTTQLDLEAVQEYSAELYRLDGEITLERAQVMSKILLGLSADQKATLDKMVGQGMTSWPRPDEPEFMRGLPRDVKVNIMTYAGDLFSWYAGSIEADTYINPERQATYFGSFYLKDAPAVGNPGYTISSSLTSDMGGAFIEILTDDQKKLLDEIVANSLKNLEAIVADREALSTELRKSLSGEQLDETTILQLMESYGREDGAISYLFATNMAQINASLTEEQRTTLVGYRTEMLGDLKATQPFIYSLPVDMPTLPSSDFLFE